MDLFLALSGWRRERVECDFIDEKLSLKILSGKEAERDVFVFTAVEFLRKPQPFSILRRVHDDLSGVVEAVEGVKDHPAL